MNWNGTILGIKSTNFKYYHIMKRLLGLITCSMLLFTFMACDKDDEAPEGVVRIVFA